MCHKCTCSCREESLKFYFKLIPHIQCFSCLFLLPLIHTYETMGIHMFIQDLVIIDIMWYKWYIEVHLIIITMSHVWAAYALHLLFSDCPLKSLILGSYRHQNIIFLLKHRPREFSDLSSFWGRVIGVLINWLVNRATSSTS